MDRIGVENYVHFARSASIAKDLDSATFDRSYTTAGPILRLPKRAEVCQHVQPAPRAVHLGEHAAAS